MSPRASPRVIGVFVLTGVALAVASVAVFGSGRLFHDTYEFVSFFDSDVGGLGPGSAVKFRGVEIGTVQAVFLNIAAIEREVGDNSIPAIFDIDADLLAGQGARLDLGDPALVDSLINAAGLSASLATESLITGQQYIALDIYLDRERRFVGTEGTGYTEVPTVLTGLEELEAKLQNVISAVSEIELDEFFDNVGATIASVRAIIERDDFQTLSGLVATALGEFDLTLVEVRGFLASADSTLTPIASNMDRSLDRLRGTADEVDRTLTAVRGAFEPEGQLAYELTVVLRDLGAAARSFRNLADYLERNPSALIRGRPGTNE